MTAAGVGTTFRITLPLTLSTQRVLLVRSAGQLFAFPVNAVERVKTFTLDDVYTIETRMAISLEGRAVSIVTLDSILGIAGTNKNDKAEHTAIVINQANERAAFVIEEVVGEQER